VLSMTSKAWEGQNGKDETVDCSGESQDASAPERHGSWRSLGHNECPASSVLVLGKRNYVLIVLRNPAAVVEIRNAVKQHE
jgi:hypothetical protein